MTEGVAKRRIEALDYVLQNNFRDYGERDHEAMVMAIKALSAIEDIKAEINEFIKNPQFGDLDMGASCGAVKCLEIIDKHIGGRESE